MMNDLAGGMVAVTYTEGEAIELERVLRRLVVHEHWNGTVDDERQLARWADRLAVAVARNRRAMA